MNLILGWIPYQAPGVMGSVLGVVGPVSVYCSVTGLIKKSDLQLGSVLELVGPVSVYCSVTWLIKKLICNFSQCGRSYNSYMSIDICI